jgi:hypothetical protein
MPELKKIELSEYKPAEDQGAGWGGWPQEAWAEDSRALVAFSDDGVGFLMEYEGVHLDFEINEYGLGSSIEDLQLDTPKDSAPMMIWTGRYKGSQDYWGEYDYWAEGEWRELTDEEWRRLRAGEQVLEPSEFSDKKRCEVLNAGFID